MAPMLAWEATPWQLFLTFAILGGLALVVGLGLTLWGCRGSKK